MTDDPLPIRPPQLGDLPRLPARCRLPLSVETFEVEEVPRYTASGEGDHTYAWIEKRDLTTFACVKRIADALEVDARSIGYAGLKDRHAITRQWLSIEHVDPERVQALEIEGLRVLEVSRHHNKLKLGHLDSNRFAVRIACEEPERPRLEAALRQLETRGVPNFFGAQRFGSEGRNLAKGLRILTGKAGRRRIEKPLFRILLSSVQSEVFNRVLARRLGEPDRYGQYYQAGVGDVAWLHANGACFAVDDAASALQRSRAFEISPSGPMPGPKCLTPTGPQRELESEVLAELGVEPASFAPFRTHPGERRSLRMRLRNPSVEAAGADAVIVRFQLDRGAFATTVLGELIEAVDDDRSEPSEQLI